MSGGKFTTIAEYKHIFKTNCH